MNNIVMNTGVQIFESLLSIILCIHSEWNCWVKWHLNVYFFFFLRTTILFHQWLCLHTVSIILPSCQNADFFTSMPTLFVFLVFCLFLFYNKHLDGCHIVSDYGLICFSLMISDFMCLRAIFVSSLKKYLFVFLPIFFSWAVCFFVVEFWEFCIYHEY